MSLLGLGILLLLLPAALAEEARKPTSGKGQIRGEVTDASGAPLVGVSIILSPAGRPDIVYATSTDEDGRYAFNGLVPETYQVQAHGQGVMPVIKTGVRVKPPFRAITDMSMAPAESVEGALAAASGAAAEDDPATSGPVFGGAGSLARSTQSLSAGGGARGPQVPLSMPFLLEEEGRITLLTGIFLDAEGVPVMEGSITLRRIGHPEDTFYARTDDNGHFRIEDIPSGVYDITTRSPGLIPLHMRQHPLPAQAALHLQLAAPDYPLTFQGFIDDLLPEEIPMPPPMPREVDLLAGGPAMDAPLPEEGEGDGTPAVEEEAPSEGTPEPAEEEASPAR